MSRRKQRQPAIHQFFMENVGRSFHVSKVAEELFPDDFKTNPKSVSATIATSLSRMMEADPGFERINRGMYRYNPESRVAVKNEAMASGPNMFETISDLGEGLLLKGDDDSVWVARRIDGNDLIAMLTHTR